MVKVYEQDKEAGTLTFTKPKAERGEKAKKAVVTWVGLNVPTENYNGLAELAHLDGFEPDADTEKGQATQTATAVRSYINLAIEMLLAKRAES